MKRRLLFVDDEENVLDGLRRILRSTGAQWDMVFVDSGEKALETLKQAPFDVVIADMRMPGMDGARLLGEVNALTAVHAAQYLTRGDRALKDSQETAVPSLDREYLAEVGVLDRLPAWEDIASSFEQKRVA